MENVLPYISQMRMGLNTLFGNLHGTILVGKDMVGKLKTCGKSSILISLAVCSCEIKDHATDILVLNTLVIETNNHSQIPPNKFVVETWYYRATVT